MAYKLLLTIFKGLIFFNYFILCNTKQIQIRILNIFIGITHIYIFTYLYIQINNQNRFKIISIIYIHIANRYHLLSGYLHTCVI